jgi:hypothetical protein
MTFSRLYKTFVVVVALALMMVGFATIAQAIPEYDATADGALRITGITIPGSVVIEGEAFVSLLDEFEFGDASATAVGTAAVVGNPSDLGVDDGIDQSSHSFGSANSGYADSIAMTDGVIHIFNNHPNQDVTVSFSFDYNLSAFTSASDPYDFATAEANVFVYSDNVGDLVDDAVSSFSDFGFSDGLVETGDTVSFDLTVLPGGSDDIVVSFVDTYGSAEVIPEPTTIVLMGFGILGLLGVFIRQRRKEK